MRENVRVAALEYIQSNRVMTLATLDLGNGGGPKTWAAAVFYATAGFNFYFLSASHTRHAQNMLKTPLVSATIQTQEAHWGSIQGIQMEGDVVRLDGAARVAAIACYLSKFPFIATDPTLARAINRVDWFRLTATALYFIDNSKGLGHRTEVNLRGDSSLRLKIDRR